MASTTNIAELQQGRGEAANVPAIFNQLKNPRFNAAVGAVAAKYFTPERFVSLAINSIKKTPLLAQCDPQSVLGAFMTAAALGLEPNTPTQQAFLIPYKKRAQVNGKWVDTYDCQFIIGYRGYITLAYRSPLVASIEAEAIHENDHFVHMQGSKSLLEFRKTLKDRGPLIGAYCLVRMANGTEIAVTLPLDEIEKIRGKSETYNSLLRNIGTAENAKDRDRAQKKLDETPWVMWEDEMSAKSAIRRLLGKRLPMSGNDALSVAARIDEDTTINMAAMTDPAIVRGVFEQGDDLPALTEQQTEHLEFPANKAPDEVVVETRQPTQASQARFEPPPMEMNGPTIDDALASVTRGNFDEARDLANSLGKDAVAAVEKAISAKAGNSKTKGSGSFGGVE